jgi:hypothetical protein
MDYYETLKRWNTVRESIQALQKEEQELRKGLFAGTFQDPREGVNNFELPDGSKLKGTFSYNRKLIPDYADKAVVVGIPDWIMEKVVLHKPELSVRAYKDLDDETRKKFDILLEIKPAMPKLEYVPGKD